MPPFSGKKKKEQLQAKRQRKRAEYEETNAHDRERERLREELVNRGEVVTDDLLDIYMRQHGLEANAPAHGRRAHRKEREQQQQHSEGNGSGAREVMYSADRQHGVRSVFAAESAAVIAARKQLSYQPIPFRTTMPVTGIPIGEWFSFPSHMQQVTGHGGDTARHADGEEENQNAAEKAELVATEQARRRDRPLVASTAEALGGGSGSLVFPFAVELPSRGWHLRDSKKADPVSEVTGDVQSDLVIEPNTILAVGAGTEATSSTPTDYPAAKQSRASPETPSHFVHFEKGRGHHSSSSTNGSSGDEDSNEDGDTAEQEAATNAADKRRAEALRINQIEQSHFQTYTRCVDGYPLPEAIRGLETSSYERNLGVWQQLWRAAEMSDVLVIVADARYPIIHAHLGLLSYLTMELRKPCVFVLNKEDLVPQSTLRCWQEFLFRYLIDLGFNVEAPGGVKQEVKGSDNLGRIVLRTFTTNPRPETAAQRDEDVDLTRRQKQRKGAGAHMYEKLRTGRLNVAKHLRDAHRGGFSDDDEDGSEGSKDSDDVNAMRYNTNENFVGMHAAEHALLQDQRAYRELAVVAEKITELLALCRQLGAAARDLRATAAAAGEGGAEAVMADMYSTSNLPCSAPGAVKKPSNKSKKPKSRKSAKPATGGRRERGNSLEDGTAGGGASTTQPDVGSETSDTASDVVEERLPDSPSYIHIGFIGHPNVGKSSLLNCIRGTKVVSVSATPGHTKHIQTIPIPEERVTLVDSPGLALPVLGVPRPLQAVLGTHQIAQTRDPQSGVTFLAAYLPIEKLYGLRRPTDANAEDEWSAYELCEAYAQKRGYYVKHGKGALDLHRAAIAILQEAYEGRLALFYAPPELNLLQSAWYRERVRPHLLLPVFQSAGLPGA